MSVLWRPKCTNFQCAIYCERALFFAKSSSTKDSDTNILYLDRDCSNDVTIILAASKWRLVSSGNGPTKHINPAIPVYIPVFNFPYRFASPSTQGARYEPSKQSGDGWYSFRLDDGVDDVEERHGRRGPSEIHWCSRKLGVTSCIDGECSVGERPMCTKRCNSPLGVIPPGVFQHQSLFMQSSSR